MVSLYSQRKTTKQLVLWDFGRGVNYAVAGGKLQKARSTLHMLERLAEDYPGKKFLLFGENSGHSFNTSHELFDFTLSCKEITDKQRESFIKAAIAAGHEPYEGKPRSTANSRRTLGLLKSDENDLLAMEYTARNKTIMRMRLPEDRNTKLDDLFAKANDFLKRLRMSQMKDAWTQYVYNKVDGRYVVKPKAKRLDNAPYMDGEESAVWNNGDGKLHLASYAAIAVASLFAGSNTQFDSLIGYHENGRPSQIRATLMRDRWSPPKRKGKERKSQLKGKVDNAAPQRWYRRTRQKLRDADITKISDKFFSELKAGKIKLTKTNRLAARQ